MKIRCLLGIHKYKDRRKEFVTGRSSTITAYWNKCEYCGRETEKTYLNTFGMLIKIRK